MLACLAMETLLVLPIRARRTFAGRACSSWFDPGDGDGDLDMVAGHPCAYCWYSTD